MMASWRVSSAWRSMGVEKVWWRVPAVVGGRVRRRDQRPVLGRREERAISRVGCVAGAVEGEGAEEVHVTGGSGFSKSRRSCWPAG
jgi:hypothetical protein